MSIVPSLLQLKYLDKPCSPPFVPLRLTLATFFIQLLHVWHLHRYPVLSPGSWSVSACPVLCLFLPSESPISHPVMLPSHEKVCYSLRAVCSAFPGVVSLLQCLEGTLTSHITFSLISYLGSTGVFEWSHTPSPVPRLCTPTEHCCTGTGTGTLRLDAAYTSVPDLASAFNPSSPSP